jgi:hypothetical protein
MRSRILAVLLLFVVVALSAPGRLLEARVAGPDGEPVALDRQALANYELVPKREYYDSVWYADTQEFARKRRDSGKPRVVVFGGRGVFPPSLMAVVRRLDEGRIPCRVIFADSEPIPEDAVIVIPGGWAPTILQGLGGRRLEELRTHKTLGICAGAYLLCTRVSRGASLGPYPIDLVKGVRVGPFPQIDLRPDGVRTRLDTGDDVIYSGGAAFDVDAARVRARYPDGRVAIVQTPRAILSAVHCEMNAKRDADLLQAAGWPRAGDGRLFLRLVRDLLGD